MEYAALILAGVAALTSLANALSQRLEYRIVNLEKRLSDAQKDLDRYSALLEEKEAENSDLRQTIYLQVNRINYLESKATEKDIQIKKLDDITTEQAKRIAQLYEMVKSDKNAGG